MWSARKTLRVIKNGLVFDMRKKEMRFWYKLINELAMKTSHSHLRMLYRANVSSSIINKLATNKKYRYSFKSLHNLLNLHLKVFEGGQLEKKIVEIGDVEKKSDIFVSEEVDLANYYAVEILENIFEKYEPSQYDISMLEEKLKQETYDMPQRKYLQKPLSRVLIISSELVELNALTLFFSHYFFYHVDQVRTKNELLDLCQNKNYYESIIISNSFKDTGFNFLINYFRATANNKLVIIYLGNELDMDSCIHMGFDMKLPSLFLVSDLKKIFPILFSDEFKNNKIKPPLFLRMVKKNSMCRIIIKLIWRNYPYDRRCH